MKTLRFIAALFACAWFVLPAAAQSGDDAAAEGVPNLPARSERLDIYGAGMCHTCEWRPRAKVM
ncbi:MAG: hypothetical protein ACK5YQ_06750, partial [Betaproteobacteria bacterium]